MKLLLLFVVTYLAGCSSPAKVYLPNQRFESPQVLSNSSRNFAIGAGLSVLGSTQVAIVKDFTNPNPLSTGTQILRNLDDADDIVSDAEDLSGLEDLFEDFALNLKLGLFNRFEFGYTAASEYYPSFGTVKFQVIGNEMKDPFKLAIAASYGAANIDQDVDGSPITSEIDMQMYSGSVILGFLAAESVLIYFQSTYTEYPTETRITNQPVIEDNGRQRLHGAGLQLFFYESSYAILEWNYSSVSWDRVEESYELGSFGLSAVASF